MTKVPPIPVVLKKRNGGGWNLRVGGTRLGGLRDKDIMGMTSVFIGALSLIRNIKKMYGGNLAPGGPCYCCGRPRIAISICNRSAKRLHPPCKYMGKGKVCKPDGNCKGKDIIVRK